MLRTSTTRPWLASTAIHVAVIAAAAWYVRTHPPRPSDDRPTPIELELLFATSAPDEPTPAVAYRTSSPPSHEPVAVTPDRPGSSDTMRAHRVSPVAEPTAPPVEPPAPAGPEPTHTGIAPPSPFLLWSRDGTHPSNTPPATPPPAFASVDREATRAAINGALGNEDHGETITGPDTGHTGGDGSGAREASNGYVRRMLDDAYPTQVAGSAPYYNRVRREAQRVWQPQPTDAPSLLRTAVSTFFAPTSVGMESQQRSLGPLYQGRSANAIDDLNFAHPNSVTLQPANTMAARADATAIHTRTEVEVEQDAQGHITSIRVSRRSGVAGFDRQALAAIRQAVGNEPPPPMPGGWRSRWEFEVAMSRDPLLSALPSTPGEGAAFGLTAEVTFDEVTGETEMHLPGRVHRRRRVRLISSHLIEDTRHHP